ncbi:hypothetical protein SISNIDRAFT_498711 [Sistotremastrum niveocremeum HHB9708]|uniref:Uncharacterized protein n=1 Tax=Sistotremastrum niveocremeum HHB9708 TaxID=1314777 RepID=A0A164MKV8_9AGAM|nr:hypothetical protein SISNIDRAFT_498711 [Sistotremastrum niveocremeum HHB9708]
MLRDFIHKVVRIVLVFGEAATPESGIPESRLNGETVETIGGLRMRFAAALRKLLRNGHTAGYSQYSRRARQAEEKDGGEKGDRSGFAENRNAYDEPRARRWAKDSKSDLFVFAQGGVGVGDSETSVVWPYCITYLNLFSCHHQGVVGRDCIQIVVALKPSRYSIAKSARESTMAERVPPLQNASSRLPVEIWTIIFRLVGYPLAEDIEHNLVSLGIIRTGEATETWSMLAIPLLYNALYFSDARDLTPFTPILRKYPLNDSLQGQRYGHAVRAIIIQDCVSASALKAICDTIGVVYTHPRYERIMDTFVPFLRINASSIRCLQLSTAPGLSFDDFAPYGFSAIVL